MCLRRTGRGGGSASPEGRCEGACMGVCAHVPPWEVGGLWSEVAPTLIAAGLNVLGVLQSFSSTAGGHFRVLAIPHPSPHLLPRHKPYSAVAPHAP
jgi:hypothetical protein